MAGLFASLIGTLRVAMLLLKPSLQAKYRQIELLIIYHMQNTVRCQVVQYPVCTTLDRLAVIGDKPEGITHLPLELTRTWYC